MKSTNLPVAPGGRIAAGITSSISARALDRWNPAIRAADEAVDTSISIYGVIGFDPWTGDGVSAKRVAGALRAIGAKPVTVNLNSPGGDMFEGLAIYNLLREHPGEVTVKVLGLAASAASIVAMAGDTIQVSRASFFMIHNAWVMAVGNRHDLRDFADQLEPFDDAMASIYAARTGQEGKAIHKMMDAETWIGGQAAIDDGFADEFLPSDQISSGQAKAGAIAVRRIEAALRQSGMPRGDAMRLLSEFKSSLSDSAGGGGREATELPSESDRKAIAASAAELTTILKRYTP